MLLGEGEMFRVENMESTRGNPVPNQFIIYCDGLTMFQSYRSIICMAYAGHVYLDENYWDYSITTGKYRNIFLGECKADTLNKISTGEYKLTNLNGG